jgi:hypothetical protein
MEWTAKSIVITGASTGIGRATALKLTLLARWLPEKLLDGAVLKTFGLDTPAR